jgi:cell wall-associated NlpC family hydrolase
MTTRFDIVRVARSYVGTPFHHMGRVPGVGMDCSGVLICTGRELGLVPPDFDVPAYTPTPDGHSMIAWCDTHMKRISQEAMQPGDAILLVVDRHPQHLGILGNYSPGGLSIIHAANNASPPRVIETRLLLSRTQRFVAAYQLPGIA